MSFDGDLEHLPIVDVIQLLHATGKSGTLTLKSAKGESQLVFLDGFIVSANHVNNSLRIGQIMLHRGLISNADLEQALREQQGAGQNRKPIIQTLIEGGLVETQAAYQGLEALIEMTIVEVLTWTKGTFSLDVTKSVVSDEYRYFPETLKQQIHLNTQSILMDALRIYDERKRDGTLTPEAMFGSSGAAQPEQGQEPSAEPLSAADLGLEELDELSTPVPKLPRFFSALPEEVPDTPSLRLKSELAGVAPEEQELLFEYLAGIPPEEGPPVLGVILLTRDRLIRECVAAVCGARFICATDDAAQLDPIIDQTSSKERAPLLLVDAGEPGSREDADAATTLVGRMKERFPELPIALLCYPCDYRLIARVQEEGADASLPRPSREERPATLATDAIDSCRALAGYLARQRKSSGQGLPEQFRSLFHALSEQRDPPEVTFSLLQAACSFFQRGVTLVVVRSELIAERAIGLGAGGEVTSIKLRIAAAVPSLYQKALDGEVYYGEPDQVLRETMFAAMPPPAAAKVLLLPVKSFGRVIAVLYADFGARTGGDPHLQLLEILAQHAGLIIDNALYRKRCAQK